MIDGLIIHLQDGGIRTVLFEDNALTVGRSRSCTVHFPEDLDLSRQHFRVDRFSGECFIEDLGSKNGTRLNGQLINGRMRVIPGDLIEAGRLSIETFDKDVPGGPRLIIEEEDSTSSQQSSTLIAKLEELLDESAPGLGALTGAARVRALVNAGRELAGHRPLDELFQLILDMALQAVGCTRGIVVLGEGKDLTVRAARGGTFRLSSAVRERVMEYMESLLVVDAQLDQRLSDRMSIAEHHVRSMMAVPLRTDSRVIGMIYVDSPNAVKPLGKDDLNLLTVLANVAAIRIEHARLVEVEQAEQLLTMELQQAAEIQRSLLPVDAPKVPGLEVAGFNAPCRTIGGDYYDFFEMDDGRLMAVVGDVAGKGMPAALLMANLQARVQLLSEECRDVACMVTKLNRALALHCPINRFITFFACSVNPWTGAVAYGNAGHNPPLIARTTGETDVLNQGGLILGIQPSASYAQYFTDLNPGDVLLLYSDGVTEATDSGLEGQGEDFGTARLAGILHMHRESPPAQIIDAVIAEIQRFTHGAASLDDFTLVAIKRQEAAQ